MKRIFSVLIILAFVCMLPGCDSGKNIASGSAKSSSAVSSVPSSSALSSVDKDHFLGLTNRQMLEDYDYMWKTLDENYPYYGVAQRSGVDVQGVKSKYRAQMEKCSSDWQYCSIIEKALDSLRGTKYVSMGHLGLLDPVGFKVFQNICFDNMKSIFADQSTIKNYKKYLAVTNALYPKKVSAEINSLNTSQNVTAKVIDNDTAYVKINSFMKADQEIQSEGEALIRFYKQNSNKKNLIVDISENTGGSENYWMNNIVAPNITKKFSVNTYCLIKKGSNNMQYLAYAYNYDLNPISKLPNLPKINHDDLKNLDAFATNDISVNPQTPGKKMFQGKIWVLVSNKTYSAAEAFSSFCKRTGFATIVGTRTGGDGVLKNSFLFFTLPNSRLVVQYGCEYGLNADGSCNQEYGTAPDVVPKAGQTPYDACMEAIRLKK
ncbi:MAG TPA: S41 family peptidase [Caproicibacter sp.]|nr:S41 family peptidase [Caproicibacter sp.]